MVSQFGSRIESIRGSAGRNRSVAVYRSGIKSVSFQSAVRSVIDGRTLLHRRKFRILPVSKTRSRIQHRDRSKIGRDRNVAAASRRFQISARSQRQQRRFKTRSGNGGRVDATVPKSDRSVYGTVCRNGPTRKIISGVGSGKNATERGGISRYFGFLFIITDYLSRGIRIFYLTVRARIYRQSGRTV